MGSSDIGREKLLSDAMLTQIAERFGTPVLVYCAEELRSRYSRICSAFSWSRGFHQFFPVKTCGDPAVLRLLHRAGSGLLCSSAMELQLAAMAGVPGKDILFTACFPPEETLAMASELGTGLIVDDEAQLDLCLSRGLCFSNVGLRYNPGPDFALPGRKSFGAVSKFGMGKDMLLRAAVKAARCGVKSVGLHMHMGSNVYVSGYYAAIAGELFRLAVELREKTGVRIDWCDLSGGLAGPGYPMPEPDLNLEAELVRRQFRTVLEPNDLARMRLCTELGRWLAAPAAVFLTRVTGVKTYGQTTLVTDASLADLPRTVFSGMQHHIYLVRDGKTPQTGEDHQPTSVFVVGSAMERIDVFGGRRVISGARAGSLLAFTCAGAYNRSMSSNYGGKLRCPVVLVDDGEVRLIRRRESPEDFLRTYLP